MTSIQIFDDGTRRAVRFALWARVHDDLGDGTGEFYDQSRNAIDEDEERATDTVDLLRATLRDVQCVLGARVGETVDLEIPEDKLLHGLATCSECIVEDERFWSWDRRDARQRVLATYDAAQVLLGAERGAVA